MVGVAGWGWRGYSVVSKMCGGWGSSGELRAFFLGGGGHGWMGLGGGYREHG